MFALKRLPRQRRWNAKAGLLFLQLRQERACLLRGLLLRALRFAAKTTQVLQAGGVPDDEIPCARLLQHVVKFAQGRDSLVRIVQKTHGAAQRIGSCGSRRAR